MKEITKTGSLCPTCLRIIPAKIFEEDGKVWISKRCPTHGKTEDLYYGSYEMYKKARKFARDGKGVNNPNVKTKKPCPKNCGLCNIHKSHTALANVMTTNRCDLTCWYCFAYAKAEGYVYEPSLEQMKNMLRNLRNEKPVPANAVQFTGGEPTLRQDITDVIKAAKDEGFEHIQLNTNGINLSKNENFAKEVRQAGVNTVYLSFDGVTKRTNPKNHNEVGKALKNCNKADMGVVLVPTVINGVNDHEVGDILEYGLKNIDTVRGINYQPVSIVGRVPKKQRMKMRITIPDVIQRLEDQTDYVVKDDFYPVPTVSAITDFVEGMTGEPKYDLSTHFVCGMASYLFKEGKKVTPISRFVDIEGLVEYLRERGEELKKGKNKYWVGLKSFYKIRKFIDKEKQPKNLNLYKILYDALKKHDYESLGVFHKKSLFIGLMHFQDLFNYDIERVKRCCIHYSTPDGKIIPFCAFNVLPSLYRDKVQEKYAISIKEWEKKNGRKLEDDLYRRVKKNKN